MKFTLLLLLLLSSTTWAKWSVATYNIRNFDSDNREGPTDLTELGRIIKSVQSDVMAFEEVVNVPAFQKLVKDNLPGYSYEISSCGGMGKQQLAVVYNLKTFEFLSMAEDRTFSGSDSCGSLRPVLLVDLVHKETKKIYTFGVVHLKAGGSSSAHSQRWKQYQKLVSLTKRYAQKNLILLGDFNTTGYSIKDDDFVRFEDFIGDAKMRSMTETLNCTSYWNGGKGLLEFQPSILDHIVIQDKQANAVEGVKIGSHCAKLNCRPATPNELGPSFESVSDHCPVQVTFK